jgi:APA family basic amino acid/polyamine antiporter
LGSEPLRREIGLFGAVMLVIGGIVGAGVFANPAVVAQILHTPVLILLAWIAGGVVALLGAFVYAELAQRIPETGGEYAYLTQTYGPLAGFLFGWTSLLVVQAGGMAFVTMVFARYFLILTGWPVPEGLVGVLALAALALANCLGVKAGNGAQALIGVSKVAVIAALIACGLIRAPHPHPLLHPVLDRPASPDLLRAFGAALIPVLFAYGGWQTANFVGGEMKDARRDLTRALVLGVLAVIVIYLGVNLACLNTLGAAALGRTQTPVSDVLEATVGPAGQRIVALAITLSTLGYLSQGLLTAPRVYYALGRDVPLLRALARVSPRSQVPAVAIIATAAWTGALALTGAYNRILVYVVAINFLFFGLSASCLFVLRRREAQQGGSGAEAGFRAPGHPWTTALFILACAVVVAASFQSDPVASLIGYGFLVLGVPVYWLQRRPGRPAPAQET